jgi:hypothetical protein
MSTYRIIGRPVANRTQPIEHNDSLDYPRTLPDGRKIRAGDMACNYSGVVGVPAGVLMDAGFKVFEQWLCEVRDHRVVRPVARVLGPAFAVEENPNERSCTENT